MRNELLNFRQSGTYQGYVAKFQEKLRLVPMDPAFAKELFLKGLSNNNLRKQILQKKPMTLEDVISEGFNEVELERMDETESSTPTQGTKTHGKSKSSFSAPQHKIAKTSSYMRGDGRKKTKCSHCQRGYHNEDDCWVKNPDKRPNFLQNKFGKAANSAKTDYKAKYYALIDKLIVDDEDTSTSPLNE